VVGQTGPDGYGRQRGKETMMVGRMHGAKPVWRGAALGLALAVLAGCGGQQAAAGNDVEMRDMDVVDGTANDAMTDLDAVRSDGIGVGSNEINASAPAKSTASKAPAAGDTETVPTE
jgi:hypothetical protein